MSCVLVTFTLLDINECLEGTDGCDQICSNTLGAYYCACSDGFTLDTDNHTCHGLCFVTLIYRIFHDKHHNNNY